MTRCAKCNAEVPSASKFCVRCGAKVEFPSLAPPTASGLNMPDAFARTALATDAHRMASLAREHAKKDEIASTIEMTAEDLAPVMSSGANAEAASVVSPRAHTGPTRAAAEPQSLSLADTAAPSFQRATTEPPPAAYSPGTRVLVQWSDGKRYPAIVEQSFGSQCSVVFVDGRKLWLESNTIARA